MDLVRAILLAVEDNPHGFAPRELIIDGYTEEQIAYHTYLMSEGGLVMAVDVTTRGSDGPEAIIRHLTWAGHEFLDSAREPGRWAQAKSLLDNVGGASISVWMSVLTELVKRNLGL